MVEVTEKSKNQSEKLNRNASNRKIKITVPLSLIFICLNFECKPICFFFYSYYTLPKNDRKILIKVILWNNKIIFIILLFISNSIYLVLITANNSNDFNRHFLTYFILELKFNLLPNMEKYLKLTFGGGRVYEIETASPSPRPRTCQRPNSSDLRPQKRCSEPKICNPVEMPNFNFPDLCSPLPKNYFPVPAPERPYPPPKKPK